MNKVLADAINTIASYAHSVPNQNCETCELEYWCEHNAVYRNPCDWESAEYDEESILPTSAK